MKLTRRELVMAGATLAVVLGGLTVWVGEPLLKRWDDAAAARQRLENDRKEAQHIIAQRADWELRLAALRAKIPQHGLNEQVSADLMASVKQLAAANTVALPRMQPQQEKDLGDGLRELAIDCQWEADLSGLVHFLHAVQVQGATYDIRQITIQPAQSQMPGRLRGNFTIFNAFSRGAANPPPASPEAPEAPPPS
jgi:hypothetical protein